MTLITPPHPHEKPPPFFSVITPSFNQGAYINDTIQSVLAQNDPDFEHLVFDNCSTDTTPEILAQHSHLRTVIAPDQGQSDALNKGLRAARGEIICWLNSDDQFPLGTFAALRSAFAQPGCDVVFGDTEQVFFDGTERSRHPAYFANRLDLIRWWTSRVRLHQPAVFFRRQIFDRVGPLREDLHLAMDYEYWWRISEQSTFHKLDRVLAIQQRQPESKTIKLWHRVYEEREQIFSPHYGKLKTHPLRLVFERRSAMAKRYRDQAQSLALTDRWFALSRLLSSLAQNPLSIIQPHTLGIFARIIGGAGVDRGLRRLHSKNISV